MRVLLDTHTFLWFALDDSALSDAARRHISEPRIEKLVSAVSLWEIAIKLSLGKLKLDMPFTELVSDGIDGSGFTILPILPTHASTLIQLPHLHRDPFDRMLVAQAIAESCPLLGCDPQLQAYGIEQIW